MWLVGLWEWLDLREQLGHQGLLRDFLRLLVACLSQLREMDVCHS